MRSFRASSWLLFALLSLLPASRAQDAELPAVPVGKAGEGGTGEEGVARYSFEADGPGVLTVVVRAKGEGDLVLFVTDGEGQTLINGRSDQDLDGSPGAEQLAVTLSAAGSYQILIGRAGGGDSTPFTIGASWIGMPELGREPDPDGRPSQALAVKPGSTKEDNLNPASGDRWDWFSVSPEQGGTLTVVTRAPEGDLVLELYAAGQYFQHADRSDQDQNEVRGNEAITLQAEAGATYYFRVLSLTGGGDPIPYKFSVGLIPD